MRLSLLLVPLLALAAVPVATADAGPACTPPVVSSFSACVGPGRCATAYFGPRPFEACAPPVCTTDLIESVSVCEDPATGCVHVYLGPSDHPVCLGSTTAAQRASPICVTWDPTHACVEPPCVYGSYGYLPFRFCLDPRALA